MEEIFEKISDSELEVMKVLWASAEALPVSVLRQTLRASQGWEATTVKTLVQRLCAKGAVTQEKRKIFYYRAAVSQTDYNSWAARSLVSKLYQGRASNLVAALVDSKGLSADDIAELKAMFEKF
ncbi:MAG: BlaI/MecI/CopY family transcriptional regulator [Eubacteriales bacterium]|nr:BlaI/MecI/CopY family transcriptional regulator [Eubacteriales bacterium]